MESLPFADPHGVRSMLRQVAHTLHTHASPDTPSSARLSNAFAILMEEFYRGLPQAPLYPPKKGTSKKLPKVRIQLTGIALAVGLSLARKLNIISYMNDAALCRLVAPAVMTIGHDEVSPGSLVKALREPTPKSYRDVREAFQQMIDYIDKNHLAKE